MRARSVMFVLSLACACGRAGYDAIGDDDDDLDAAGATADAKTTPDGAGLTRQTWTFGEAPGTTVSGVTADTWLCDGAADATLNWGASNRIDGGDSCTGLIRFDLTALPAGSTAVEAAIALWPELVPNVEGQVAVHRVTEAWDEGTLDGTAGVANYVQRQTGVDWTTRGALPPGSCDSTQLHAFHPGVYEAQIIPLPPAVVDGWIADPNANYGIALIGSGYGVPDTAHPHFLSRENSQTALRPILTVTFDHP